MIDRILCNRSNQGLWLKALSLIVLFALAWPLPTIYAASPMPVQSPIEFVDTSASPRQVEETTAAAIQRDYGQAWQSLISALQENRAEMLEENFTGAAREHWQAQSTLSGRTVSAAASSTMATGYSSSSTHSMAPHWRR